MIDLPSNKDRSSRSSHVQTLFPPAFYPGSGGHLLIISVDGLGDIILSNDSVSG
jgi:hypothetical protein